MFCLQRCETRQHAARSTRSPKTGRLWNLYAHGQGTAFKLLTASWLHSILLHYTPPPSLPQHCYKLKGVMKSIVHVCCRHAGGCPCLFWTDTFCCRELSGYWRLQKVIKYKRMLRWMGNVILIFLSHTFIYHGLLAVFSGQFTINNLSGNDQYFK